MTIQQCYQELGGSYSEAVQRLMRDTLVTRFALKFLKDDSYAQLCGALDRNDTDEAFRAAHTLKGVAMNLAFTRLAVSASKITEMLRAGDLAAAVTYLPAVTSDYDITVRALTRFQQEG